MGFSIKVFFILFIYIILSLLLMVLVALESWASYDIQIIKNLGLALELHYWGGEEQLFGNMTQLWKQGIPFLTFGYTV